jgi:hypothetical protein
MICTLDDTILNSTNGRLSLNFKPAGGSMPYNPETKNLLLVWDIMMQDWRMVNMNDCDLVRTITRNEFWPYFNKELIPMSPDQKIQYMDA